MGRVSKRKRKQKQKPIPKPIPKPRIWEYMTAQNFHFLLSIVMKGAYYLSCFLLLAALVGCAITLGSVNDPSVHYHQEPGIMEGCLSIAIWFVLCFAAAGFHRWVLLKWPFPFSLFSRERPPEWCQSLKPISLMWRVMGKSFSTNELLRNLSNSVTTFPTN